MGYVLIFFSGVVSLVAVTTVLVRHSQQVKLSKALEEVQQALEEARRRFMRRLDHEIKNPLTGIQVALANLNAAPAGSPDQSHSLQDVQHQMNRLSRLVGDLRKLAELEERPIEHLPIDLVAVLQEVMESARSLETYHNRNLQLVVSKVPWPLPQIVGDRDLIGLAFYNLVDNALKFTRPGDSIEVRAFEDGRSLIVEVADTGPGIAPDDLPRIFEELYRGNNARGCEGSGVGLALVQRIVARHGGEVSVRSRLVQPSSDKEPPLGGSVFTVRLPLP
jgi:two-component system OmpR family sensor kinase